MSREPISVQQKTLQLNLDKSRYGTLAEIGAGQEVARWFFHVGGAAGTVAKTISAYDMKVMTTRVFLVRLALGVLRWMLRIG